MPVSPTSNYFFFFLKDISALHRKQISHSFVKLEYLRERTQQRASFFFFLSSQTSFMFKRMEGDVKKMKKNHFMFFFFSEIQKGKEMPLHRCKNFPLHHLHCNMEKQIVTLITYPHAKTIQHDLRGTVYPFSSIDLVVRICKSRKLCCSVINEVDFEVFQKSCNIPFHVIYMKYIHSYSPSFLLGNLFNLMQPSTTALL